MLVILLIIIIQYDFAGQLFYEVEFSRRQKTKLGNKNRIYIFFSSKKPKFDGHHQLQRADIFVQSPDL